MPCLRCAGLLSTKWKLSSCKANRQVLNIVLPLVLVQQIATLQDVGHCNCSGTKTYILIVREVKDLRVIRHVLVSISTCGDT